MRYQPAGTPIRLRGDETVKMFLSDCCHKEIEIDTDGKPLPPCDGPRCSDPSAAAWHLVATAHF